MKADPIRSRVWAALLGFLAAFSGVGVIVTGMRFTGISMLSVGVACAFGCVVLAFLVRTRGFPVVMVLAALAGLWLWRRGPLEISCEAMLQQISSLYDMGYQWGVIRWTDALLEPDTATLALSVTGLLVELAVIWSVVRGRGVWLAVLAAFAPLIPCMLLTDTVPAPGYLYFQILVVLLLLLQQAVRKRNAYQANRLMRFLTIPVAAALIILFIAMPREGYTGYIYAQKMQEFFVELFQGEPPAETGPAYVPGIADETPARVNLTTVGSKVALRIPVMEVTAEETSILYLRGTSYDTYRGTRWDEDVIDDRFAFYNPGSAPKKVTITTRNIHDLLFAPYAPLTVTADGDIVKNGIKGRIENEHSIREYTVTYSPVTFLDGLTRPFIKYEEEYDYVLGKDGRYELIVRPNTTAQTLVRYLQLGETTRVQAEALLAQELPELGDLRYNWEKAQAIAQFVQNSAAYDLQTQRMPENREDFAMWFLLESDTGYCTHFATATTVLLRAAGIPARYVTGFIVQAEAGQSVTVLQKNAHAWTEVYIDGSGWVVLDATPSGGIDQTIGAEYEGSTESTGPAIATDPTDATDPEDTTSPEETTLPTQPHETTDPTEETAPTKPSVPKPGTDTPGGIPGGNDAPQEQEPFVLPGWAKTVLWILAMVTVVVGQWKLRVALRKRRHTHGSNNARVLAMWQDVEAYARLLNTQPEETLLLLAQKARFSQHRLTKEEVLSMEFGMNALRRTLWNTDTYGKWKRLYAQLILTLY